MVSCRFSLKPIHWVWPFRWWNHPFHLGPRVVWTKSRTGKLRIWDVSWDRYCPLSKGLTQSENLIALEKMKVLKVTSTKLTIYIIVWPQPRFFVPRRRIPPGSVARPAADEAAPWHGQRAWRIFIAMGTWIRDALFKNHQIMMLLPSGKHTQSYWTWPLSSLIYPSKMVIFHSYVSLPEGTPKNCVTKAFFLLLNPWFFFLCRGWLFFGHIPITQHIPMFSSRLFLQGFQWSGQITIIH